MMLVENMTMRLGHAQMEEILSHWANTRMFHLDVEKVAAVRVTYIGGAQCVFEVEFAPEKQDA